MANINYKKLFAIQKRLEEQVKKTCPQIQHKSGIYFYTREDEDGKYCYIGKSVDCLKRSISHLQGYQRIDLSLRKRGFYSSLNTTGWKLNVMYCPESDLDRLEQFYIEKYKNAGYEMYNVESGGTTGKTIIGERKPTRGYRDGIKQGRKQLRKELNDIILKYLVVSPKNDTKLAKRALDKFNSLLSEEEN